MSDEASLAKLNAVDADPLPLTQHPDAMARALALSSSDGGRVLHAGGDFNAPNPGAFAAFDACQLAPALAFTISVRRRFWRRMPCWRSCA